MEGLEELKNKVDKLEYIEIKGLKEDVNKIKIDLNTNNILTQQSIESNKKLSNTMDSIKDAMIELGNTVKDGNNATAELNKTVLGLKNKVNDVDVKVDQRLNAVDSKINEIDNKSKFDFVVWLKNNFIGVAMGIASIVYFISQISK